MDSRARETRALVKITPREKRETRWGERKTGTTRSLNVSTRKKLKFIFFNNKAVCKARALQDASTYKSREIWRETLSLYFSVEKRHSRV